MQSLSLSTRYPSLHALHILIKPFKSIYLQLGIKLNAPEQASIVILPVNWQISPSGL
jgi:hypothetical protein